MSILFISLRLEIRGVEEVGMNVRLMKLHSRKKKNFKNCCPNFVFDVSS